MALYVMTIGAIFVILLGGILADRAYRTFAARHPQLGPFRKGGCGSCSCHDGACDAPPHH
jgi:hypothetical protein